MSTSSTSLALALALAGCNQLLGLDRVAADPDGDGVGVTDNCPTVANPDQHDIDGDGIGDVCDDCNGPGPTGIDANHDGIDDGCSACDVGIDVDNDGIDDSCDTCLLGGPHDEDGDGVPDACDNCLVDPNPDQARDPTSATALGTACDVLPAAGALAPPKLQIGDPFAPSMTTWAQVDPGWSVIDDALAVSADDTPRFQIAAPYIKQRFLVQTRVHLDGGSGSLGLRVGDSSYDVTCMLSAAGQLSLTVSGLPPVAGMIDSTDGATLRLTSQPTGSTPYFECSAIDAAGTFSMVKPAPNVTSTTRVGLEAVSVTGTFDYLWAIDRAETGHTNGG